ncbi:hypothetical protein [Lactovum miscens]|uniref:Uncharacterized protein n=1 Tax=Lactovum miscens TaxID=190387 RepID=A0A841C4S8_9LACT|nr:hypothetical protein [Lactovum miscens]MBB5887425.1 hypothetical protein [Lactovum miscens]
MPIKMQKKDELDSLFAELGVLEMPDGISVPEMSNSSLTSSESEDPYAKWLSADSENN